MFEIGCGFGIWLFTLGIGLFIGAISFVIVFVCPNVSLFPIICGAGLPFITEAPIFGITGAVFTVFMPPNDIGPSITGGAGVSITSGVGAGAGATSGCGAGITSGSGFGGL